MLFITKSQANEAAEELEEFSRLIYKTDFDLKTAMEHNLSPDAYELLAGVDAAGVKQKVAEVLSWLSNLPVLTLTLAFKPNIYTLKRISGWLKIHIDENLLIDLKVDPALIGGAVIEFGGKRREETVRGKIKIREIGAI